MARIKITNATIQAKLTKWAQGQERTDELIFFQNEINEQDVKQKAWDLASMIVNFEPDTVSGFTKIVFVEKL
jgi:hypothetical protein